MKKKIALLAAAVVLLLVMLVVAGVAHRVHLFQQMNPEGAYFDSQGVRIHYRDIGAGTPLILVHGLAVNGGINFDARGVVDALASDWRVIVMDNRGHGRSDKPHDPTAYGVNLCDDIVRLMDHLNIEKAHVLGYSMGGFIVLKLAERNPERLLSFMVCASGWTADPEPELVFFDKMADILEQGGNYALLSERLTPIGREVSRRNRLMVGYGLKFTNDNKAIAALLRSVGELGVGEAALRANTVPALGLVGDRDPLRPFTEQMAETTANMRLVIVPDADHMSTLRRAAAMEAIQAHLSGI